MARGLVELGNPSLGQLYKLYPEGLPSSKYVSEYPEHTRISKKGKSYSVKQGRSFKQGVGKKSKRKGVDSRAYPKKSPEQYGLMFQLDPEKYLAYKNIPFQRRKNIVSVDIGQGGRGRTGRDLLQLKSVKGARSIPPFVKQLLDKRNLASEAEIAKRIAEAEQKGRKRVNVSKSGKKKGAQYVTLAGTKSPFLDLREIGSDFGENLSGYKKKKKRKMSGARMGQQWLENFIPLRYEPLWIFGGNFAGAVTTKIWKKIFTSQFAISPVMASGLSTGIFAGIQYMIPRQNVRTRSFVFGMILSGLASTMENLIESAVQTVEGLLSRSGILKTQYDDSQNLQFNTGNLNWMEESGFALEGNRKNYRDSRMLSGNRKSGLKDPNAFGGAIIAPALGKLTPEEKKELEIVKEAFKTKRA